MNCHLLTRHVILWLFLFHLLPLQLGHALYCFAPVERQFNNPLTQALLAQEIFFQTPLASEPAAKIRRAAPKTVRELWQDDFQRAGVSNVKALAVYQPPVQAKPFRSLALGARDVIYFLSQFHPEWRLILPSNTAADLKLSVETLMDQNGKPRLLMNLEMAIVDDWVYIGYGVWNRTLVHQLTGMDLSNTGWLHSRLIPWLGERGFSKGLMPHVLLPKSMTHFEIPAHNPLQEAT